jgi:hypothetical protein
MSSKRADAAIPELTVVALIQPRQVSGKMLPEGAKGAVVHAYRGGDGYEVEFDEPFHCVITVRRDDIRQI